MFAEHRGQNPLRGVISVCVALLLAVSIHNATAQPHEYRAFWLDAFHSGFMSQAQVDTLLGVPGTTQGGRIRDANCNAVIIQVRKRADVCYPSGVGEPYMSGLSPIDFNALAALIKAAHDTTGGKKRIEVHCWSVAFKTAKGLVYSQHSDPPTGSLTEFDNYWVTRLGLTDGPENGDGSFDPGHPKALEYLVNAHMDLVNFQTTAGPDGTDGHIDGIHYDYIRFEANTEGFNPTSVARYNARYGLGGDPDSVSEQFKQWRRDQVSAFVRQMYARIQKTKPWIKQSGAFVTWNPSPVASTRAAFQGTRPYYDVYSDWDSWMEEGIMDLGVPMAYYRQHELPNDYVRWINFIKDRKFSRQTVIGPGIYLNYLSNSILHLQMTRDASPAGNFAQGFCGYSYAVPYIGGSWPTFAASLVSDVTPSGADIPPMPWKTNPTHGHLMGVVTLSPSGAWADHAVVNLSGPVNRSMYVDGTGFYAFIDLPPGAYTVSASKAGYPNASSTVDIALGQVTGNMFERNLVLSPTAAPSITIQPGSQTVVADQDATFSVTAEGTQPLAYEWRREGVAIPNATGSQYTRPNVQPADAGEFNVVVTNLYGAITSAPAVLNVHFSLDTLSSSGGTISRSPEQPTYLPGTLVTLTAAASAGHTFEGWTGDLAGTANQLTFAITSNMIVGALFYSTLTDIIIDNLDSGATFNGVWQTGSSGAKWETDYRFALSTAGGTSNAVYRPALGTAGFYDVCLWYTRGNNRGTNAPWSIHYDGGVTNVPVDQTINGSVWLKIGSALPFARGTDGYVRLGTDVEPAGKALMADAVRFTLAVVPPMITSHPASRTNVAGTEASFSTVATGTEPLGYQWQFNGGDIEGANASSFTRENAQNVHAGLYSVVVSNIAGAVTSAPAALTVTYPAPPHIVSVEMLSEQSLRLQVDGGPGQFRILRSPDFVTWGEEGTLVSTGAVFEFNTGSNAAPTHFYRVERNP